jgi:hypothetical protein
MRSRLSLTLIVPNTWTASACKDSSLLHEAILQCRSHEWPPPSSTGSLGTLVRLAVARDVEVLAAISASAIVLFFLDLPHLSGTVAVEGVWRGEFPAQAHGAARMHTEELAHVIAIERDEVRDLLSLRLGEAQPLTGFDDDSYSTCQG